jgi:hypothetical protein
MVTYRTKATMSSYTITITPDDTSRASTTLRVDVSDNSPRITELLVRAGTATGLSAQQLPAVDLDLLLRAVTPTGAPMAINASGTDDTSTVAEASAAPATAGPARRERRGAAAAPAKRAGRKQAEPAAATGRGKAAEARAAKKAAKATRTTGSSAAGSGGERAYRRAPADLAQVFQQAGGVTAVARHYGVPRHTAQSWVRRLRQQGLIPAGQ